MGYSLQYYKNLLINTNNKIAKARIHNKNVEKEVKRLEKAYKKVKEIKDFYAEPLKKDINNKKCSDGLVWRGQNKDDFDKCLDSAVKEESESFYKSIDAVLDNIGTALSKKQGEYKTGSVTIDKLLSTYRYVQGIIRNWTN